MENFSRRAMLKAGLLGMTGLSLADVLRAQDNSKASTAKRKSVILIWLDGGPSQLESYDPKPEAPLEVRGPFGTISTSVPGITISDLLPCHAPLMDKMALVRSLHHDNGDHFAAAHWMLTGFLGSNAANKEQKSPSLGSCVARVQGPNHPSMPAYVGLPAAESIYLFPGYQGAAYLGRAYEAFDVQPDQKYIGHAPQAVLRPAFLDTLAMGKENKFDEKLNLLDRLDGIQRSLDRSGSMESMDKYQHRALDMLLSGLARRAFDMDLEDARVRDMYGPGPWGHYTCMARRLVEAGVSFVTVDMPHWDHHSSLEKGHGSSMRAMDRAVGGLLQDLMNRDMLDDVLVLVMGEFGRTPKINQGLPNIDPVPGRDHWGNCFSAMLAGGGIRGGQVIGATNPRGEYPSERPLMPGKILATVYHLLGIDASQSFLDHSGRPRPMLDDPEPIRELV